MLGALHDDPYEEEKYARLEGIPPKPFDGNHAETEFFLSNFSRFMTLNRRSTIAKDPFMKCAYFLSLIEGGTMKGWVAGMNEWLEEVQDDPSELPPYMTAWQVMKAEFKKSFVNYSSKEKAYGDLSNLKMTSGGVDEYIADFTCLAREAGIYRDDTNNLRMFARGLPKGLCDDIMKNDDPDTFEEWTKAAQNRQHIFMKQKSIHTNYGGPAQSQGQQ